MQVWDMWEGDTIVAVTPHNDILLLFTAEGRIFKIKYMDDVHLDIICMAEPPHLKVRTPHGYEYLRRPVQS